MKKRDLDYCCCFFMLAFPQVGRRNIFLVKIVEWIIVLALKLKASLFAGHQLPFLFPERSLTSAELYQLLPLDGRIVMQNKNIFKIMSIATRYYYHIFLCLYFYIYI